LIHFHIPKAYLNSGNERIFSVLNHYDDGYGGTPFRTTWIIPKHRLAYVTIKPIRADFQNEASMTTRNLSQPSILSPSKPYGLSLTFRAVPDIDPERGCTISAMGAGQFPQRGSTRFPDRDPRPEVPV
jgi:hypothetical protein